MVIASYEFRSRNCRMGYESQRRTQGQIRHLGTTDLGDWKCGEGVEELETDGGSWEYNC
jgi:hypothetical protein